MPQCSRCEVSLNDENWPNHRRRHRKYQCTSCTNLEAKEWRVRNSEHVRHYQTAWQAQNAEKAMWLRAKQRANKKGVEFTIRVEDIIIPPTCPILGVTLVRSNGRSSPNSPSLDRIDPSKGYIPGNVTVISNRANTLKSNASVDELELVLKWMKTVAFKNTSG